MTKRLNEFTITYKKNNKIGKFTLYSKKIDLSKKAVDDYIKLTPLKKIKILNIERYDNIPFAQL